MGRNEITEKNVFDFPSYKNIIYLISQGDMSNGQIRRSHLRVLLCKNHGLDISHRQEKKLKDYLNFSQMEFIEWQYKHDLISEKIYKGYKKICKLPQETQMVTAGWLKDETKFATAGSLNTALYILKKKLKLIDTKKSKKGYNHYVLTPRGYIEYSRWFSKNYLINLVPDNEYFMARLQVVLKTFLRDECKVDIY